VNTDDNRQKQLSNASVALRNGLYYAIVSATDKACYICKMRTNTWFLTQDIVDKKVDFDHKNGHCILQFSQTRYGPVHRY